MQKYEKCYVVFIDILGFKEITKNYKNDEIYSIFQHILNFEPKKFDADLYSNIGKKIMSDSIILYIDVNIKDSFYALIDVCSQMQTYLLDYKHNDNLKEPIFLRGGIATGSLLCDGDIIFGDGLTKAYNIENSLAIVPRIVFLKDTLQTARENVGILSFIDKTQLSYSKDKDELYYVNFLNSMQLCRQLTEEFDESKIEYINKTIDDLFCQYTINLFHYVTGKLHTELKISIRQKYLWVNEKIKAVSENFPNIKQALKNIEKSEQLELNQKMINAFKNEKV